MIQRYFICVFSENTPPLNISPWAKLCCVLPYVHRKWLNFLRITKSSTFIIILIKSTNIYNPFAFIHVCPGSWKGFGLDHEALPWWAIKTATRQASLIFFIIHFLSTSFCVDLRSPLPFLVARWRLQFVYNESSYTSIHFLRWEDLLPFLCQFWNGVSLIFCLASWLNVFWQLIRKGRKENIRNLEMKGAMQLLGVIYISVFFIFFFCQIFVCVIILYTDKLT